MNLAAHIEKGMPLCIWSCGRIYVKVLYYAKR